MWEKFLDILFPRGCFGCRQQGTLLCDPCLASLPLADNDLPRVHARFAFASPIVRQGIWSLKYKGVREFASIFGTHLGEYLLEELPDLVELEGFRDPILMPTPISKERLAERGYNQALLIAERVAAVTGLPLVAHGVVKIIDTPSQVSQHSRAKRLANLQNAFTIPDPKTIAGENIILIDDVYTTGATLHEISQVLLAHGARDTFGFTLAH